LARWPASKAGESLFTRPLSIEISFDIRFLFAFPVAAFVSQKETESIWEDQLSKTSKETGASSSMDGCRFAMRAIAIASRTAIQSDMTMPSGGRDRAGRTHVRARGK
jgi:hypothetical protein